jgi:hypothetical protein
MGGYDDEFKDEKYIEPFARRVVLHELLHRHPMFRGNENHCEDKTCLMHSSIEIEGMHFNDKTNSFNSQELCPNCDKALKGMNFREIESQLFKNIYSEFPRCENNKDKADIAIGKYAGSLFGQDAASKFRKATLKILNRPLGQDGNIVKTQTLPEQPDIVR